MWMGLPQPPVPLCSGCYLSCSMAVVLPTGVAAVPVPNDPALCGACICVQGASVFVPSGPGCNLGGYPFTLSDCLRVLIGC